MTNPAKVDPSTNLPDFYTLIIVSRRSRHRAGERYVYLRFTFAKYLFTINTSEETKAENTIFY
jgi:hypothetical protein